MEIVTTANLLRGWAVEQAGLPGRVAEAVRSIELRASFVPGRNDPHRDWWITVRR